MSKITIMTDSTCDIPSDLIEEYHISIVPLYVIWGDEELLDLFWQEHGDMMHLLGYGEDSTNLTTDAPSRAAAG